MPEGRITTGRQQPNRSPGSERLHSAVSNRASPLFAHLWGVVLSENAPVSGGTNPGDPDLSARFFTLRPNPEPPP